MSINNVKIENFTVFKKINFDFTSGINMIIGENGTGKTHLMKLLYANHEIKRNAYDSSKINDYFGSNITEQLSKDINSSLIDDNFEIKLTKLQNSLGAILKEMDNKGPNSAEEISEIAEISMEYLNLQLSLHFKIEDTIYSNTAVFIPAKDMLTHSKGLLEMIKKYSKEMPFDKTLLDIIEISKQWKTDSIPILGMNVLPKLEKMIDGKVIIENDTFFIEKSDGSKVEFSLEAEGIKKIAILWQLIMNESITEGTVLFWDEPEANINPSLYQDVADILLELSRNGVQIFLATHNYNFAKYFEVLSEESDSVRYHSLYKTDDGVKCETESKFSLLSNNALREDNINLYDAEMKKEFAE